MATKKSAASKKKPRSKEPRAWKDKPEYYHEGSRHGVRAPNTVQTSVTIHSDLLDACREVAKVEGRSFSNLLARWLHQRPEVQEIMDGGPAAKKAVKKK